MSQIQITRDGQIVTMRDGHVPQTMYGLDASKSPSPGIMDVYIATDTGKTYTCFVPAVWSLTSSPCYEAYDNHMGNIDNLVTITGDVTADAVNHRITLSHPSDPSIIWNRELEISNEVFELNIKVNNINGGTLGGLDTDMLYTFFGVGFGGVSIRMEQETHSVIEGGILPWTFVTSDGITSESTIVPVVNGDLVTFKNYLNIVMCFVNGVLMATHSTVAFSGATAYPTAYINGQGSGRTISLDYIGWRVYT